MSTVPNEQLICLLKEDVISPDLSEKSSHSFLLYLYDLDVLEPSGETHSSIKSEIDSKDQELLKNHLLNQLNKAALTEAGFALSYFLINPPQKVDKEKIEKVIEEGAKDSKSDSRTINPTQKSSNLSNLQIVRKVGNQLSSFIELESWFMEHLQGVHVTKQDARNLFNFILPQIKDKGKARPWEQLSRKRHR